MFERFTDRARRVVVLAQEEARMLGHNYIGTEHILLGLIHEGEGVAAKALESLGVSQEAVRQQVEVIIGQGEQPPSGHIPFTPRAKKVLGRGVIGTIPVPARSISYTVDPALRGGGYCAAMVTAVMAMPELRRPVQDTRGTQGTELPGEPLS
jgi:hypothetical protein